MMYLAAIVGLAAVAFAKEIPRDPVRHAELYESGVMHERIMMMKEEHWAQNRIDGVFNTAAAAYYEELHFAQCRDGKSIPFRDQPNKFFRCNNVSYSIILPYE
jgi:hypothetical protein